MGSVAGDNQIWNNASMYINYLINLKLFKIYRTAIIESKYGPEKMLPSVNDDGTPKHETCMASHARKIWALQRKYDM